MPGFDRSVVGVLIKDGWLSICVRDAQRTALLGMTNDILWRKFSTGEPGMFVGPLRELVVLAMQATEITTDGGKRQAL